MNIDEIKVGDVLIDFEGRVVKVIEIKGENICCEWSEYGEVKSRNYKPHQLRNHIKHS